MIEDTKEDKSQKIVNKKITVFSVLFIVCIIILVFLIFNVFQMINCKECLENSVLAFAEKNEKVIFNIDKTTLFSSADTKNKTSSVTNFTIENLYQFTDIALYINNNSTELTEENTLKSLSISNIQFLKMPEIGQASLYYKNLNDFAKGSIEEANKIEEQLNFEVSSEDQLSFDTPAIYNNCASPIVLSYVNENIKTDYTFTDSSVPITYDGSLLRRLEIPLESLNASISFDVYITNNLDQKFKTTVYLDIPLQSKDRTSVNK